MTASAPWDWPPEPGVHPWHGSPEPRRRRAAIDVEITVAPGTPRQRSIASKVASKVANGFFFTMVTLAKLVVAAFATGLVLGSIALLVILVEAAMK